MDSDSRDTPEQQPEGGARLRKARAVLAVGALALVVGVVALTMGLRGLFGGDGGDGADAPALSREAAGSRVIEAQELSPGSGLPGTLPLANAIVYNNRPPIYQMTIEAIDVDAPVLKLWADSEGVPLTPNSSDNVAWYNFSAWPGSGGNAVFAAHVTWAREPAVFARLGDLEAGDIIRLESSDGDELTYKVFANFPIDPKDPDSLRVMAPTPRDTITLITCGGSWVSDPSSEPYGGDFTERTVVQAHLVTSAASAPVPRGASGG